MKKLVKLLIALVALFFLVKLCTSSLGSVITLPGGIGGTSSDDSGGWFSPKDNTSGKSLEEISSDLEKELGIGKGGKSSTTINIPSSTGTGSTSTASSSSPITFKGIPITGSLSEFGSALVNAGFRNNGNGTYTGEFAGYSACKITPSGNNPVKEVRVDFPVITDWDSLEKAYDGLQASLTQKYGIEPVVFGNVATFNLENGTITLDADVKEQSSWHVILKYAGGSSTETVTTSGYNPIDDL